MTSNLDPVEMPRDDVASQLGLHCLLSILQGKEKSIILEKQH